MKDSTIVTACAGLLLAFGATVYVAHSGQVQDAREAVAGRQAVFNPGLDYDEVEKFRKSLIERNGVGIKQSGRIAACLIGIPDQTIARLNLLASKLPEIAARRRETLEVTACAVDRAMSLPKNYAVDFLRSIDATDEQIARVRAAMLGAQYWNIPVAREIVFERISEFTG